MTGRNPMHTGLDPMNWTSTIMRGEGCDPPQSLRGCDSSVSAEYVFMPRLLRSAGYESAMLGKVRDSHIQVCGCCLIRSNDSLPDAQTCRTRSGTSGRSFKILPQSGVDSRNRSAFSVATKPMTRTCSGMDAGTCPGRRVASRTAVTTGHTSLTCTRATMRSLIHATTAPAPALVSAHVSTATRAPTFVGTAAICIRKSRSSSSKPPRNNLNRSNSGTSRFRACTRPTRSRLNISTGFHMCRRGQWHAGCMPWSQHWMTSLGTPPRH